MMFKSLFNSDTVKYRNACIGYAGAGQILSVTWVLTNPGTAKAGNFHYYFTVLAVLAASYFGWMAYRALKVKNPAETAIASVFGFLTVAIVWIIYNVTYEYLQNPDQFRDLPDK